MGCPTKSFVLGGCSSLIACFGTTLTIPAQRVPDIRVNRGVAGSEVSQSCQIAASGSGVYITWLDYRNGLGDIYFNRSLDGGATWLANDVRLDTDLPGAAMSSQPQIHASGASVYVTWSENRHGAFPGVLIPDVYFNRSLDGGRTWLPSDVRIDTSPPGSALSGRARVSSSGSSVYVAWEDARNVDSDVYFNRSVDGGVTWLSSDIRVNNGPAGFPSCLAPEIASAGASVYVTWSEARRRVLVPSAAYDVYFNRSLDGGTTWLLPDVRLDTDLPGWAHSFDPVIAAAGSSVYVAWADERNGGGFGRDIYFNRSLDSGASWLGADVRLDTDPPGSADSYGHRIAASGSNVYVTWFDGRNGAADIYFNRSLDGGATWLTNDVRLDTDPPGSGDSWYPRIAASGTFVYVTWYDDRSRTNRNGDVYFNRSTDGGATWLASDVRLNTGRPPGAWGTWGPVIAAVGPSAFVAWEDTRSSAVGRSDIYFNVPFGSLPYGPATAGAGGIAPVLGVSGSATIGSAVSADVSSGLGAAVGALFVGSGAASRVRLAALGGTVLVQPSVVLPLVLAGAAVPGGGVGSVPLQLPADPALIGANLHLQGLFLDPGAAFLVSMTNGVELWIG